MRNSNKSHVTVLGVPISAADRQWLDAEAARESRSRAAVVRRLIRLAAGAAQDASSAPASSNSELNVPA
jgi:hypothetical protein